MAKHCFNCDERASAAYTLILDSGELLEDKPMCERCRSFLGGLATVEIVEAPVLIRGGDGDEDEG